MNTIFANSVYEQLQRQVHRALLLQHPEWILPDGTCPIGDAYKARFVELLTQLPQTEQRTATYFHRCQRISTTHQTL